MLLDYFGLWYRKLAGTGGAGSATGKKKQIYVEQDGKILLFKNARQASEWINAQKKQESFEPVKHVKKIPEPRVIDKAYIEPLAIRFDLVLDFKKLCICEDMEALWELAQRILRMRDEEDIAILLLST